MPPTSNKLQTEAYYNEPQAEFYFAVKNAETSFVNKSEEKTIKACLKTSHVQIFERVFSPRKVNFFRNASALQGNLTQRGGKSAKKMCAHGLLKKP